MADAKVVSLRAGDGRSSTLPLHFHYQWVHGGILCRRAGRVGDMQEHVRRGGYFPLIPASWAHCRGELHAHKSPIHHREHAVGALGADAVLLHEAIQNLPQRLRALPLSTYYLCDNRLDCTDVANRLGTELSTRIRRSPPRALLGLTLRTCGPAHHYARLRWGNVRRGTSTGRVEKLSAGLAHSFLVLP